MSRDNITPLQDDNVEYLVDINDLLIIDAVVTNNETIGQLKYNNVYILNNMKDIFQDQLLENVIDYDNKKYENVENVLLLTTELLVKETII